jgi:hypothetical protein
LFGHKKLFADEYKTPDDLRQTNPAGVKLQNRGSSIKLFWNATLFSLCVSFRRGSFKSSVREMSNLPRSARHTLSLPRWLSR